MSNEPRYPAEVFYSEDDEGYIAIAPDLPGCSAFGESAEEALHELRDAVKAWIGASIKAGNPIPAPSRKEVDDLPSGKVLARLPKTLHAQLIERASRDGTSLNTCLVMLLSQALAAKSPQRPVTELQAIQNQALFASVAATKQVSVLTSYMRTLRDVDLVDFRCVHVDSSGGGSKLNLRALPANRPVILLDETNG
jgi:antitoxin HicB